jgi:ABC-type Fe3+-siderophore transport system permease subunit
MGSIYGSTWRDVVTPLAVRLTMSLRALQGGDGAARSLGISLEKTRLLPIVVRCALAAVSVAIAGRSASSP